MELSLSQAGVNEGQESPLKTAWSPSEASRTPTSAGHNAFGSTGPARRRKLTAGRYELAATPEDCRPPCAVRHLSRLLSRPSRLRPRDPTGSL
jgi:hypothetical protein